MLESEELGVDTDTNTTPQMLTNTATVFSRVTCGTGQYTTWTLPRTNHIRTFSFNQITENTYTIAAQDCEGTRNSDSSGNGSS